ncbi:MAG: penicillin-binding protein 2 [Bacteroidales bacterium]|nr:penicillin-binding protein 2 [Bacteroidales bacterium]
MINDTLQNRRYVIAIIMSVVIVVYILRLFSIQIIETKYKEGAESNAFLKKTQFPPRGLIYDRNHTLLVYNKPAYDISCIMREIHDLDTLSFCRALNIDKKFFINRIAEIKDRKKNLGYSSYTPQVFMTQLDIEDIATIQQSMYKYPGFFIQNRTLREYAFPNAAHVLGNIGEVSKKRIENDEYYKSGDYAGRDGIEYTYEKALRGVKGVEILLRDAKGRIKGKYEDGNKDIPAIAGENLTLTLDIRLQILGEKLMTGKVGSIVAIEPSTGEILAMVSNPAFNPSILVGRQRSKNYTALLNDPTKPLMNRATQAQYSPGSSFKPIQALVCQQMGGITEKTIFSCNGPESSPVKCTHHHGSPVSLLNAIEQSCNPYFWNAFRVTIEKDGYGEKNNIFRNNYDAWVNNVKSFGLGEKFTDSDIYEQSRGYIPTQKYYNKVYRGETGWRAITIRSNSIGQGEILATPLQLANAMATIANSGYYITPHLNKCDSMKTKVHRSKVDEKYFPIVVEGMSRVFEFGTARLSKIEGIDMCGKTGTVQNSRGKDHSIFVGFAPRENPKIAIAVVVENAGFGSTYAAPVFSLLVEQYIRGKIERLELQERVTNIVTNTNVKER